MFEVGPVGWLTLWKVGDGKDADCKIATKELVEGCSQLQPVYARPPTRIQNCCLIATKEICLFPKTTILDTFCFKIDANLMFWRHLAERK